MYILHTALGDYRNLNIYVFFIYLFIFGCAHGIGPKIESELPAMMDTTPWQCQILNLLSLSRNYMCLWVGLFQVLFFSFLATPRHKEFPGQGSDPSCLCDLCSNCINTRSFNPLCQPGAEPVFWCCRDTTKPIVPQQELLYVFLNQLYSSIIYT